MFVGRERELNKLEELYRSGKFECAVIYGRRRVGKTALIREFIRNRKAIFFTATETSGQGNLENFSRSIHEFFYQGGPDAPLYRNFEEVLKMVCDHAAPERLVLVIDEYPYLAASYRAISSILQKMIDHQFRETKLMLILCGSSMSFMENQVMGYKSPLYGRRTAQFKIEPLGFFESKSFFTRFKIEDLALVYGITWGVPQYLELVDEKKSAGENIRAMFLDPKSYLFEEPSNLLKQEVREPAMYNAIIRTIAMGSTKLTEIADKAGIETALSVIYLRNLCSLGIVKKEEPVTGDSRRKTIYRIGDSMYRFWYRFVPPLVDLIMNDAATEAWKWIEPELPAFMGHVFEDISKEWLWRENTCGRLPFVFSSAGRWWGHDNVRKEEVEIDILGFSPDREEAIFGECKWTNSLVDAPVLETLSARANLFRYRNKYLYLFAKRGFTAGCKKAAGRLNARLITFAEMNSGL
ncbi:MAG: ATP-binding protein [Treponema sp.]|jgi:AAA+ ATPase superfamily predicted ATPase|nr:ATP-binding protein [Treponema sp.]